MAILAPLVGPVVQQAQDLLRAITVKHSEDAFDEPTCVCYLTTWFDLLDLLTCLFVLKPVGSYSLRA
jgi:hypothetical protein